MGLGKDLAIRSLLLVAIPWVCYVAPELHHEVQRRQVERPGEYPQYSDLLPAFAVFLTLAPLQLLFRRLLSPLARRLLHKKDRWGEAVWDAKVGRCCDAVFKFLYYTVMTTWGYLILRDKPFVPWALLGAGETRFCWTDYPFQAVPSDLRYYYLAALGYQLTEDAMLIMERRLPDFWEMALHHTVSFALILVSYMMNYVRVGCLTLFVHNFSDIFIYASKALVDTKFVRIKELSFLGLFLAYFWFRIYVFPTFIISTAWVESITATNQPLYGWGFVNFALCVLFLLHTYWFGLIVKVGLNFQRGGKLKDIQANLSGTELHKKVS